jgi:hypothetical protein
MYSIDFALSDEYRILVGKCEGKRSLGRPRCRWEYNTRIDLREMKWEGVDWINLTRDKNSWERSKEISDSIKGGEFLD